MSSKPVGHAFVMSQIAKKKRSRTDKEQIVTDRLMKLADTDYKGNVAAFAKALEIPYTRIMHIRHGKAKPGLDVILKAQENLGVTLDYLFGLVDRRNRSSQSAVLKVFPTDNQRKACDQFEVTAQLLGVEQLKPGEYAAYRVMDDANAPDIPPQSNVVVDRAPLPGDNSGYWAISLAGEIQLRQLSYDPVKGTVTLSCTNPSHKTDVMKMKDFADVVVGRVIWSCRRI